MGVAGGSVVKNLSARAGDVDVIPRFRRFPGEGNGNPFQYACLEISMDRGVHGVHGFTKESDIAKESDIT